jgi:DNA-binding NarL/FixJ family response regulator
MPGERGLKGIPKLPHEHPEVKIVVLSMEDTRGTCAKRSPLARTGTSVKRLPIPELVTAIREVAGGGHV